MYMYIANKISLFIIRNKYPKTTVSANSSELFLTSDIQMWQKILNHRKKRKFTILCNSFLENTLSKNCKCHFNDVKFVQAKMAPNRGCGPA